MRSIAILNQKGGVGKTTTAVNLASAIARMGHRVCLLDLDPQAHASLHLGIGVATGSESIYQVLMGEATLAEVCQPAGENLWCVPAHLDLAAAEMELAGEVGREMILRDALEAHEQEYDFLIIDCPPSLGVLTLNALACVGEVFLPLQPHFLALHGLSKLLRTVDIVSKRINPTLRLTGVVLCLFESGTRLAGEVAGDVHEFFSKGTSAGNTWSEAEVFQTRIRRNIRLAEAPSFGQSIFEYDPHSNGAEDYANLAREVMGISLASEEPEDSTAETAAA
ncbi:ParA family protein [Bremerella cremea]|uniref:ParA family protein n=1 Tax=Bremerella cremea TaxID=1031537 RepID=A0A368KWU8_9BACT|nr:AAA family ATPase [Bremerella cremea]RCS53934.1 ParA family protein [Bremerella cremea]